MSWFTFATTIFYMIWLLALLTLLYLIWRSSERRLQHVKTLEKTLLDVAMTDAESAKKAVQTTQEMMLLLREELHHA